jgi:hypothetical protein
VSRHGPDDPPVGQGGTDLVSAGRRRAHRMAWLYTGAVVVLLPWIVYLAVSLPKRNLEHLYRFSWVGFDILLVVALARTAYMAFRVDQRVQFAATATATLLIVDAWFDITTSSGRTQVLEALVLAAFIELPAAIFSLYLARQVNRRVIELADFEGTPLERSVARQRQKWSRRGPRPSDALEAPGRAAE